MAKKKSAKKETANSAVEPPKASPGKAPSGIQTPVARRQSGAKEVIPFEWKLIGDADGLALTLFKAILREDVEAQLERVKKEGYYKKLRILGATDKVPQAPDAKARAIRKTAKRPAVKGFKTRKSGRSKPTRKATPASKSRASAKSKAKAKAKAKPRAKAKPKTATKKKAAGKGKSAKTRSSRAKKKPAAKKPARKAAAKTKKRKKR